MFELILKIMALICGLAFTVWFVALVSNYVFDVIENISCSLSRMGFRRKKDAE